MITQKFIVSIGLLLSMALFILPQTVTAIEFTPQVSIGNISGKMTISSDSIGKYIVEIYKYGIGITGILAVVVMMWGGTLWITSGGNPSQVQNAQAYISGALTGLVLALSSYTILAFINPDLTKLKPINPTIVSGVKSCCSDNGTVSSEAKKDDNINQNSLIYSCPEGSEECTGGRSCNYDIKVKKYTCTLEPPTYNCCTCSAMVFAGGNFYTSCKDTDIKTADDCKNFCSWKKWKIYPNSQCSPRGSDLCVAL